MHKSKVCLLQIAVSACAGLISVLGFMSEPASAEVPNKPDFVLTQKSTRLGDCYLYISPQGFHLVNPHSGFTISARAPEWRVYMYNTRSHLYYESSMEAWCRDTLIETGYDEWSANSKWVNKGAVKICGYKGTMYQIDGTMRTHNANGTLSENKTLVGAQYVLAEGYQVSPKFARMMNVVFNLPMKEGIPLRMNYINDKGLKPHVLDTYRIDRCKLAPENFNLPVGYTLAHSRAEIMADPAQLQMMQRLAGNADLSDPKTLQSMETLLNKNAYGRKIEPGHDGAAPRLSPQSLEKLIEVYRQKQQGTK
jgi:hypothetical protein